MLERKKSRARSYKSKPVMRKFRNWSSKIKAIKHKFWDGSCDPKVTSNKFCDGSSKNLIKQLYSLWNDRNEMKALKQKHWIQNYEEDVLESYEVRNESCKPKIISNETYKAKFLKRQVWNKSSGTNAWKGSFATKATKQKLRSARSSSGKLVL